MTGPGPDPSTVRRWSMAAGEPAWLRTARAAAAERLPATPPPPLDPEVLAAVFSRDNGDWSDGEALCRPAPGGDDESELTDAMRARGVIVGPLGAMAAAHPDLVRPHLGSVVGPGEDRLTALSAATWTGGTLVHVPPGVEVDVPIQATSARRAATAGRFERTLVIVGEGASVQVLEGCSAPVYAADAVRCSVVEVVVGPGARVVHTTIQNWSTNVFNLAIKRAVVGAEGRMEWVDGTMGAARTVTRPGIVLAGPKASGSVWSAAVAGAGQHHDVGARLLHRAPETRSSVEARLIAADGGRCRHRALVDVGLGAGSADADVRCSSLIMGQESSADAALDRRIRGRDASVEETVRAGRLDDEARAYLHSRGLTPDQADALLLNGFLAPVSRRLPLEYAVEWDRLVENRVGRSVG